MAKLVLIWDAGKKNRLAAHVITPNGDIRQKGAALTEHKKPGGIYVGSCPSIQTGDLIMYYEKRLIGKNRILTVKRYKPIEKGTQLRR